MRNILVFLLLVTLCLGHGVAQFTPISASHLNVGGKPITTGKVLFTPVDANGQPIAFVQGGGGLNSPTAIPCNIAMGALSGCQIPDACLTTPSNILYTIDVIATGLLNYRLPQVAGICGTSPWALDAYAPPASTTNVQPIEMSYGTAAPPDPCVPPSEYIQNSSGGKLYICVGTHPVLVTASSGGASIAHTANVLKGDNSGNGVAATPGTDYVVPGGNVATATALSGAYSGINTFGDSITDGAGSTTVRQGGMGAKGYAWQLINAYGSGTNYGYGGDQAGDLALKINNLSPSVSNNFLTTIMVSTNDQSIYGGNSSLQAIFQNALGYSIVQAAVPEIAKLHFASGSSPNPACTFTSSNGNTWNLEQRSGFVLSSMDTPSTSSTSPDGSNATCSLTTYQTGPIYLSYLIFGGWPTGSVISVTVDGGSATVFNSNPSSSNFTTANGNAFFPVLGRIPGPFPAGVHTVSITLAGGGMGDAAEVFWLAAPWPASSNTTAGNGAAPPDVFVGGTPWQQNDTGEPLSGTYNGLIQTMVSTLAGDGLPVHFVDIRSFLNSTTDFNGGTLANGIVCPVSQLNPLHPGDCGHAHLAQAFLSQMPASNLSGPLPGPLTYYGPVRSTTGGGGWVFGSPSAWQVGTSIGVTKTCTSLPTVVGGIITGC